MLERGFRENFGCSPWADVMQLRLGKAEQLLCQTRLSTAGIAEISGCGTPEHSGAAFRKLTGMSPSAAMAVQQ